MSISRIEDRAQIINRFTCALSAHLGPDPRFLKDRLYNLDSGVLFYIPIWLCVANHEYPKGLKSSVWWYYGVCGKKTVDLKKIRRKNDSKKNNDSEKNDSNNGSKRVRKRHWAFIEAHREASTPIVSVRDSDFSSPYWWADIFDFEVENVDIKENISVIGKYSPKIPIWLFLNIEIMNRISEYAISYVNEVHDKKILLENENENKFIVLEYITRFSEKYLKKIKHKLYERGKYLNRYNNYGYKTTFITITVRAEYHSLKQLLDYITKLFHKFVTHLKYYVDWLDYIRFFEIGKKRNMVHIHLLLVNKIGYIDADIVRKAWSKNGEIAGGVHLKYFDNVIGGVRYTLKYITKLLKYDYDSVNSLKFEKGFLLLSLLWSANKRIYSVSAKFTRIMLELIRATAKNFVVRVWFGFVVQDPGLLYYTKKYSDLSPPADIPGGWVYVGSYDSAVLPLPCGIYDYEVIKEYLYALFEV